MEIDKLNVNEKDDTIILISIWDDLGDINEADKLNCAYCRKVFNFLDRRFD